MWYRLLFCIRTWAFRPIFLSLMLLKPRSVREFRNPSEDYSVRATAELT